VSQYGTYTSGIVFYNDTQRALVKKRTMKSLGFSRLAELALILHI